ncbi:MAG TPA: peptidylprolyl isomerase [Beijerinckiaceae bacterium]|jgi:peptidyl-prolyl cis-trans isomerase C
MKALTLRSSLVALALAAPDLAFAQAPATAPAPAAQPAANADKVLARGSGITVTERDLQLAAEDPALNLPGVADAQKRDLLIGYMTDLKLGAKAATDAKIGDSPDFQRRLAYLRDKALLDEYLEREVKKGVTPDAVRKLYDDTVKNLTPEPEVRARHILVEKEEDAKAIAARVKKGEDFAKIAAEASTDPGSKAEGGDLGFFTKERMVQPFAEAAFKMEPGQVSEPVKSQFGWHVIKVEEKRTKPVPAFEEMKEQVESYLARKTQQDIILSLRSNAKVERLDDQGKPIAAPETKKP